MIIVSKYDHVNLCAVGWYCCWLVLLVFCCVPSYIIVMFSEELKTFKRLGFRHVLLQVLNFASVIASGLMIWKGLGLVTNSESPIVVVLSGSMEPAFYRGDLLFLTNPPNERYHTGDITVYKIPGADIPIVHRVLETHDDKVKDKQLMLTKGDNNYVDDLELYQGLKWLERKHIVGKVRGFLPYIGYVTIAMNDFPQLKYALLGGLGLLALIQRE
ncbi:Signal peptidase complex catalytic subunit [Leucoagaricus gongylophorus]